MLNPAATIAGMTETHGTTASGPEPPQYRAVSVNQVVAWNLARYRRAAGMTQEQLGLAIGWKMSAVSDAERSWSSGRTREFSAQEMTEIAVALGIPVTALLLPPDPGDGEHLEVRNQDGALTLAEYMEVAVMPDSDLDEPATQEYRDRYTALASRHLAPEWAAHVTRLLAAGRSPDQLADLAALLRDRQHAAEAAAAQWRTFAGEMETWAAKGGTP
jgi:transcriptional regulator with XRE-family HTH domain